MATTSSIIVLLNFYASRQNNAFIDYRDFSDYLKRYAEHHVEEQPELIPYLGNTAPALDKELSKLVDLKQILMIEPAPEKRSIIVIPFYIDKVATRYREIIKNPALPFPLEQDLPKQAPNEIITREQGVDFIGALLEKQDPNERRLYSIVLPRDVPAVLLPSNIPVATLLDTALFKLRTMLHKEEFYDYFQKKLTISNPGKEIGAKNFFTSLVQKTDGALVTLRNASDTFYFWSQLCYFIRQDYEKVKDRTQEDISTLQAVGILEIAANYFKSKTQQNSQREAAFQELEQQLKKPPYYFTFESIMKFSDSHGVLLLGQYSDDDLKEYLQKRTTQSTANELPSLLVFKTDANQHYFIEKPKVLPLIVRLCNDARITVKETLSKNWYIALKAFETLPEMLDQKAFERRLELEIHAVAPILSALLNTSFLPLIHYEANISEDPAGRINLFSDGVMISYSEMLMMDRKELLTDAKILLPIWYTAPVISWFARLFFRKTKQPQKNAKSSTERYHESEDRKRAHDAEVMATTKNPAVSLKAALHQAARAAEDQIVPASSTLDRELNAYMRQWNTLIGKETSANLTEDVNSLIRDYLRKVIKTFKAGGFTMDRIENLAETLVKTPGMQKIKDHDALKMYIELYLIKLVKNIS
jgi:hypothetical protein